MTTFEPSAPGPPGRSQTLRDSLRLLWSRRWFILLVTVVVVGGVEALTFRQSPVYESSPPGRLEVPPPPPILVRGVPVPQPRPNAYEATQAQLIQSPVITKLVVDDLGLDVDPTILAHRIVADPITGTDILRVTARASSAARSSQIANAVMTAYLDYRHTNDSKPFDTAKAGLEQRIREDRAKLKKLSPDSKDTATVQERSALLNDINLARSQLADLIQNEEQLQGKGKVLEVAGTPSKPSSPDRVRSGLLGLVLGLLIGSAGSFLVEYFRDSLTSPEEVEELVGAPVLAVLPLIGRGEATSLLLTAPDVPRTLTESVRTLRTNLWFAVERDGVRSLLVTSPRPGDGKTMVAANLAVALAQVGVRTVLIEGDLRRPRLHRVFGTSNEHGMSSVLRQGLEPEYALTDPGIENLRIVGSGPTESHLTEALSSDPMKRLMALCRAAADFILIDSPPLIGLADPAVLAAYADAVLVVLDQETGRRTLKQARDQLGKVEARILGLVVNKTHVGRPGYEYYGYSYPYYEDGEGRPEPADRRTTPAGS